jgi:hypothetical protein
MSDYMNVDDAIRGSKASCFTTIEGNRYNLMNLIDFEAKLDHDIKEVTILGKPMKSHKPSLSTGTFSGKMYYNTSLLRELAIKYVKTGKFPRMEIQITNDDDSASIGRQSTVIKECLMDSNVVAKLAANGDLLEEDISGTFDDIELPEKFKLLEGMK